MSKKVVPFALPPRSLSNGEGVEPSRASPDSWILDPQPAASAAADSSPAPTGRGMVIDLSAERTWFELMGLIMVFPCLATWCWLESSAATWLGTSRPR